MDLLFGWQGSAADIQKLHILIPEHVWIHTHQDLMLFNNYFFSDSNLWTAQLASRACARLQTSYHPATKQNYDEMFKDFLTFLVPAGLILSQVDTIQLLAFMEFLCQNGLSPSNINNYLAAVRANLVICGLSTAFINCDRIHLFLRAMKINRPLSLKILLHSILQACSCLQYPQVFPALYSFLFFSFLRLSNVLPHSIHTFDPSGQLCRGDVIFSIVGATVLLK